MTSIRRRLGAMAYDINSLEAQSHGLWLEEYEESKKIQEDGVSKKKTLYLCGCN